MAVSMPQVESPATALTVHGGRVEVAMAHFPGALTPWVDLSTGINPVAYPVEALARSDPFALPSPARLALLENAAASKFELSAGAIAAVPGSEIGLRLLPALGMSGPFHVVTPTYGTHAEALAPAMALPFADLLARASGGGTMLLANPNNPDGRITPPTELRSLAALLGERDGWLIVDEAFADVVPETSILPHLQTSDRILVLRSFGKFYGLAGVRLGFVCGPAAMVGQVRARLGAWPISSAAIEIGIAAYRDLAWRDAARTRIKETCAALDRVLRAHGLEPQGACPLFRMVETPNALRIFERLGQAGILVRPFADALQRLRFGLPRDDAALARLDQALGNR